MGGPMRRIVREAAAAAAGFSFVMLASVADGADERYENKMARVAIRKDKPELVHHFRCSAELKEKAKRLIAEKKRAARISARAVKETEEDLLEPRVRKPKNGKARGGKGPGNYVRSDIQIAAPEVLRDRRRLEREFWREVGPNGRVPFDRHCENCRRRLPHTKEGIGVLVALLIRERADDQKIEDLKKILAEAA